MQLYIIMHPELLSSAIYRMIMMQFDGVISVKELNRLKY